MDEDQMHSYHAAVPSNACLAGMYVHIVTHVFEYLHVRSPCAYASTGLVAFTVQPVDLRTHKQTHMEAAVEGIHLEGNT